MRAKGPPLPVVTRTRNRKHAPLSYSQHDAHVRTPLLAHTRTHARTHSPRGCDISARAHPRVCAFRFAIWLCAQHADVYAQRVACALVCFPLAFGQVRGLGVIGHEDCLVLDLCVRAPSVLAPSRHTLKRTSAHDRYTPHLETTASDPRHLFDLHAKQPVTTLNADGASSAHAREHWPLRPVVIYLHGGCGLYIWAHPACVSAAACRGIQTDPHRRVNRTRPPPTRGSAAADGSGTRLAAVVTVSTGGCHAIWSASRASYA
jgi:hypothetical protein